MKRLLLTALLLATLASTGQAQSANPAIWCPLGARWTYGYFDMSSSGTVSVVYARDTLIGGKSAQVLVRSGNANSYLAPGVPMPGAGYNFSLPQVITRTAGARVEVYVGGQFYTLYDFAAQPGATWLTPPVYPQAACVQNMVTVTVDSVGLQQVGGRALRWFRAHLSNAVGSQGALGWGRRVYELVGSTTYLRPQASPCGGTDPGYLGPFRSFQAAGGPGIGYNATNGTLLATTESRSVAAGFNVFPNPGTGVFSVKLPAQLTPGSHLTLVDMAGRQVREFTIGQQIDLHGLRAGAYTLLLRSPNQATLARRLMLE